MRFTEIATGAMNMARTICLENGHVRPVLIAITKSGEIKPVPLAKKTISEEVTAIMKEIISSDDTVQAVMYMFEGSLREDDKPEVFDALVALYYEQGASYMRRIYNPDVLTSFDTGWEEQTANENSPLKNPFSVSA
jgi:hypothetical protein